MAGWYGDKVRDHIDVGQAVRDAGKMGEAVSFLGNTVKKHGDDKYNKKRALVEDEHKKAGRASKEKVAGINAKGKTDSASINKSSSDNANSSKEKVAGIKYDQEKYKSDSSYKEKIDKEILTNKGKSITAGAKIKSSQISAGASKYSADRGVDGKKVTASAKDRATKSTATNSQRSSETQLKVANINAGAKVKRKVKPKLKSDMSYKEVEVQLKKKQDFAL
jgi:hypothetical protein